VPNEVLTWKPHPRQEEFLAIPDTVFEGFYGGAAGGGKSELLLWLPIVRGFHQAPRFKGLLLRRTFPELENSLILRSTEFYHKTGATYNTQKRRWTWPSGAILQFGYMDRDSDARNYDTTEFNYIGFDELTSFSEFQYRYVTFSRCRSASNLPAFVRSASNPGNIGHGWVRKRFVEPAPPKTIMVEMMPGSDGPRPIKRIFIPAKLTDNPTLLREDPTYINRLMMLPEAERRAKLDGDWYTFSGQSFEDFRVEPLPSEPACARHVIPPFEIPKWWPSILAIDWGFAAMTYAGWAAISPDRRVYAYREYVATRTKISTWASDVARLSQDDYIVDVVLDPSAWADRGTDQTVMEQFCTYSHLNPRKADNDRIGGKALIREFLRWKPKPPRFTPAEGYSEDIAQRILRTSGPERYAEYRELFAPEAIEVNLPRLQIFDCCPELIKTIPLCVDDERRPEDVATFNGDDPYDYLRYLLKGVDYFTSRSSKTAEILERRDRINREFTSTGDTTAFYRKMEALERKGRAPVSLPLFHHRRRSSYVAF